MKKLLCMVIAIVFAVSSFAVYADTDTLFSAYENAPLSANTHTEMTIKLNRPFEFINQLISEEEMYDMPIDIQMLAESACSVSETLDMTYSISDDNKKIKVAASTEINMPLEFNESLKADIWAQIGIWIDADFTDEENPVFRIIYKVPFSTQYLVLDYADVVAQDDFDAEQFAEYIKKYTDEEMKKDLAKFFKEVISENMTIKETSNNREYILTADDEGFKNIIKGISKKMFDLISDALEVQEQIDNEEYRYQLEQYLSVLDEFELLGKDGFKIKATLKNKQISVSEVSLNVCCNLYDAITAFGGDMSEYDREKWWLDFTLSVNTTYENVNQKINVGFPELTEENSINILEPDYYDDYTPMYNYIDICTKSPVEPDADGNFAVPLKDAMVGCSIAKKYYSVEEDKITITPREGQYGFTTAEMNVGSDILTVDGVETTLYTSVVKQEDGTVLIPIDAITTMTGYSLDSLSQGLDDEDDGEVYISLMCLNPDYEEDDYYGYSYVSPYLYIYGEGTPVVKNNELYIPLRNAMLEFGIDEENISASNGQITVVNTDETVTEFSKIILTENSNEVLIDQFKVTLDNPVIEINGSAYFPSQLMSSLSCTVESVTYYFDGSESYDITCFRQSVDNSYYDWEPPVYEYNYLYVEDSGTPLKVDGEYYLPLWPLMGELMVSGDDILEIGETVTVLSADPSTGFRTLVITGTSVTMDDKQFTMTKPMVERDGKKYLPAEFVTSILGGTISRVNIYYGEETSYNFSANVPNPLYVEEE